MTSNSKRMKERVSLIAKSSKTLILAVAAVIVVLGITAGCTFTGVSKGITTEQEKNIDLLAMAENGSTISNSSSSSEQLKSILTKSTTDQILFFQSFSIGDNQNAAFGTVGSGEVWYVTDSGAQKLKSGINLPEDGHPDTTFLWTVDNTIIFKCEDVPGGSSTVSYAWYVKDGKPVELPYTGASLFYIGNGLFTTVGEAFDLVYTDGLGAGHTYKPYYLYWATDGLKEFGGLKISQQQFLKLNGASEITRSITQAGYTIDEIYYRANNIININYHSGDKNNGDFNNVTIEYQNNTLTPKWINLDLNSSQTKDFNENNLSDFTYGGIYQAALFSEISTYPDNFPMN